MADTTTNAGGPPNHPPTGPILVPITFSLDNTVTITAFTTINATISMTASEATGPITIAYYENNNLITVPNMPAPVWSNGVATFGIVIDQTLLNALSSHNTTLVVWATSGNGGGSCSIPIAFP